MITIEQIEAEYARVRDTWTGMTWDSTLTEDGTSWAFAGRQSSRGAQLHVAAIHNALGDEDQRGEYPDRDSDALAVLAEEEADDVAAQAERAELRAAEAMASVRAGDWVEAERSIDGAAQIEREYGDDPTWGRLARMIEQMRKQLEDAEADAETDALAGYDPARAFASMIGGAS